MLFCARCDAENEDGAATCAACGASMASSGTMVMSALPLEARPKVFFRAVRADGGPETVIAMTQDTLECGREGDIPLPDDPFVAQTQARFFFSGARLAVEDVGAGNGIFLRLHQERELPVGGELRFGRQRMLLEPVPAPSPGPGGALIWGSPDPGYRLRLIQLLEGGIRGVAFPLKEGDNHLGREHGDLTFPTDSFVSGRHALLKVKGERLLVKDLGSSNGTFIRLAAPSFLDNGDQLLVGRQLLRVELHA